MSTPEKKVQNKIIDYLKELQKSGAPLFYERRQAGGASYRKGIPDIYAVYNGKHIEIEVKQINGSLSTMQEKYRDYFLSIGIYYICAMSVQDVKDYFNEHILVKF